MQIKLTKCKFGCFEHKSFDFFGSQDATQFIVEYSFKRSKSKHYGLLETHKTYTGGTMCTLNGEIMYNFGKDCLITGYCPIKITNDNMSKLGVTSMGLKCPIIKKGDNIADIAIDTIKYYVKNNAFIVEDKDVLCITESVVARSQGNYVTIDDIVQFLNKMHITKNLILYSPIMSRNRFSMILKAFARYADSIKIVLEGDYDEQGNPNYGINQFTGVDIQKYYAELCESENCKLEFYSNPVRFTNISEFSKYFNNKGHWTGIEFNETFIDCRCHPEETDQLTLKDIMISPVTRSDGTTSGYNNTWGLLGSNKADEETLKLFPRQGAAQKLVQEIQKRLHNETGKWVEVLIYGDGCFKDPVGGIWEFADPATCPAYTKGLEGSPNELKLKALADGKFASLNGNDLQTAIECEIKNKSNNLVGEMASQGTTPRRYIDLLASLADLTSGSGDKGTPMVYIKNYFDNYATEK